MSPYSLLGARGCLPSWTRQLCTNCQSLSTLASVCPHARGFHAPLAGWYIPDTPFCLLPRLHGQGHCRALAPALSRGFAVIALSEWETLLPSKLPMPRHHHRIEDGAGLQSTACWTVPAQSDIFGSLRKSCVSRILSAQLHKRIAAALASGFKMSPVESSALAPFLGDLCRLFPLPPNSPFQDLVSIAPGQPCRLGLLYSLARAACDPDLDFIPELVDGVHLGISLPMTPCPCMFPPACESVSPLPLAHCTSAWKSALDDPATVDTLLQTEIAEGWVRLIPGGLPQLQSQYSVSAVGKLGLVKAQDRPPRLVVDSSISGVTANTTLPNPSANPTLSSLRHCLPTRLSRDTLTALVLDVSKAHRRIKIAPSDQGLLCFHHRNRLYQCLTLNFGARASGFYWARLAGLLTRLGHRFIFVLHSLLIYVDDFICLLHEESAPVWASVLVLLLCCLGVPMSWRKAALSARPVWIGWSLDLHCLTADMEPAKKQRLLLLLRSIHASKLCHVTLLQKLTGKLLWLSALLPALRPSLTLLYSDQYSVSPCRCL